jgi:hypothetical protein
MAAHNTLTGADLHEPKGVSTATSGQLYVANGAGSGVWTTPLTASLTATAAEINRATDVSTRLVSAGGTLAVTETSHDGKTILLNALTGSVATLPAATGSGARFRFLVSVLATSNSHIVKVANASDIIQGAILMVDQDTIGTVTGFVSGGGDDTITLNRTTTGSVTRGEWIMLEDMATNVWAVQGMLTNTGAGATPFSATV